MKVHTRVANDLERKEHKLVIIETEEKVYKLDYKNGFALISLLKDADSFKAFDDICLDFKSSNELEEFLSSNGIKYWRISPLLSVFA